MNTRAGTQGASLADVLRHGSLDFHQHLQEILSNPDYFVTDKQSQQRRREDAYDQLRYLVKEIGSTREVATDLPELFAVFDWSAVLATDLIPLISGHFNLASGSLATLTDSDSAAPYLQDLDDASAIGVMLLTEYGCGSNIGFMQTTATWDGDGFVINTPNPRARKFMPSVGIPVSRVCVVGARYIDSAGVDQGVHLFTARLRDANGEAAPGVTISQLDHQPLVIMDNSVISFDNLRVERSAWLSNNLASIDDQGVLTWRDENSRKRAFASAISQLTVGRLALSSCLNASARASLYIALRYAAKRVVPLTPFDHPLMADLPHVRDTLLTDLAGTIARTVYGNSVKTALAGSDLTDRNTVVSVMLAKHFIQLHALDTVTHCRIKMGAQGMFSANRVADYLGVCHAAITGEGDCYVLGSVAGRVLAKDLATSAPPAPRPHDPTDRNDRARLFRARTLTIVQEAQQHLTTPGLEDRLAVIPAALDLAEAYCAEEALRQLDGLAEHPELAAVRDVFALHYLVQHATWYLTHGLLALDAVATLEQQLRLAVDNLAEYLEPLLDAFEFNDEILGAPVLSEDLPQAWDNRIADPRRH
ncbi:acyl-CoA dehydrogenase [Nocardia sp. CDC153]|uniref:acyl-CoA dehydrogenase family protein n=1 Tax=Nocardia sp. CDC153 TaxID=3112167 RepID=UPI002DB75022|nr:acyl-CoA dehydrogenase [Nocardia sp. CDC153]MEC3957510.1 acyl-CoA dehydrogenase [Nocardia sp. CDC153]